MNELILSIVNALHEHYWSPLYEYLKKNPVLIKTFPALLLEQQQIVIYISNQHLAIEYFGNELTKDIKEPEGIKVLYYEYVNSDTNFFEDIIGFKFDSTLKDVLLPLPPYSDDLVFPTNKGFDKLQELNWNWMAQNALMAFNSPSFCLNPGQFTRIVNGRFFDADDSGLKTRHIKWIDFIPLEIIDEGNDDYTFKFSLFELNQLVKHDAHFVYPLPPKDDFKFSKLPQVNRFLELIGNNNTTETQLTTFLELPENQFILTMGFLAKGIYPQLLCEWQSEIKDNIKPDFFIVRPNGYADIVEFKLPNLKVNPVVGKMNRETFSAEINSYISQTRVYKEYFEDPNNRKWMQEKFNIKVRYPRRILVVGRRWNFSSEEWKDIIEDYRDIEIMTFDDLTDGVVAQFYM